MNADYYALEIEQIDNFIIRQNNINNLDILLLSLMIPNLYFINYSLSCQEISKPNMLLTIKLWLEIDFYLLLFKLIISLFYRTKLINIIKVIGEIIIFCWSAIGIVIFFDYILPSNKCDSDITIYIIARTIIMVVFTLLKLLYYTVL